MPTCNGVILWYTVYLLAIVFKQILITVGLDVQVGHDTCLDCRLVVSEFF